MNVLNKFLTVNFGLQGLEQSLTIVESNITNLVKQTFVHTVTKKPVQSDISPTVTLVQEY